MTIAALYVLARGPYADMEGVDAWPEKRNALLYPGPYPVVTHPPCGPHSPSVAHQTHLSATQGPWLAPNAVLQVRKYGGIMEHCARSRVWDIMSLPYPEPYRQRTFSGPQRDAWGGFTIELYQADFGHVAPKLTWLYMVGIDPDAIVLQPPAATAPKSDVVRIDKRHPGRCWRRSAYDMRSPEARKRTPPAFARWLVDLAETSTGGRTYYYWSIVLETVRLASAAAGLRYTTAELHQYCKSSFDSTSFRDYVESIRTWSKDAFGVVIPDPDPETSWRT